MNKRQFLSIAEFRAATGLAKTTILNHVENGLIPATRLGGRILIPAVVIDQLLRDAGCPAGEPASA